LVYLRGFLQYTSLVLVQKLKPLGHSLGDGLRRFRLAGRQGERSSLTQELHPDFRSNRREYDLP
jgi:hypothetical protein